MLPESYEVGCKPFCLILNCIHDHTKSSLYSALKGRQLNIELYNLKIFILVFSFVTVKMRNKNDGSMVL